MIKKLVADTRFVRSINRAAILDLIRTRGPISRTHIAKDLGVSLPTVLRTVDALLSEGLITGNGQKEKGGGRPGEMLSFNGEAYSIICVDLGCPEMIGTLVDLGGNVLHEHHQPLLPGNGGENLKNLDLLLQELTRAARDDTRQLMGIGLGIPGGNDGEAGVVIQSPYLGWKDLPIAQQLFERFQIPVFLESDINLFTLGELGFGAAQGLENFICLTLGSKIMCGMVINGDIHRGRNFQAGTLGDTFPTPTLLTGPNGGSDGTLDSLASGNNITLRARRLLEKQDPASLPSLADMLSVYQAAGEGKGWAVEVVDDALLHISQAVANLTLLLDPEAIIITGKAARVGAMIRERILQHLQGRLPFQPEIRISALGTRSIACGAVMLIYRGALTRL